MTKRRSPYSEDDMVFRASISMLVMLLSYSVGKSTGRKAEREDAENKIEFMSKCNAELDNLFLCQSLREDR